MPHSSEDRAPVRPVGRHEAHWLLVVLVAFYATRALAATPQVVSEHPRLFLRSSDIPALKSRCQAEPTVKRAYSILREFAYGEAMQSNLWVAPDELSAVLVAYIVEGRDPRLLSRARRYLKAFSEVKGDSWTRPRMLKALAHAYDWLHEDLTEEERQECAARMSELATEMRKQYRHSDYNNHVYVEYGPLLYAGLALSGDGVDDALARTALREGESLLKEHFVPTVNQLGADGDGGWHESMSYWSFFAYEFAQQLEAWRTATGEDLFAACPGLKGAARWLLYSTRPHDRSMAPVGDINTPARWGWQETAYLPLLAARYRDDIAQRAASLVRPTQPARTWPYVLWFDPSVESAELSSLPLGRLFPGVGWAAMRSSWEEDAVWALFVCGDYYSGHQHSDQNSFVISRRGDLAVDAGEYGAKETRFHNTILIGEPQRPYGNDPTRFYTAIKPGSEFDTGDILAYEENRLFTYVVGDASNAYGAFREGRRLEDAPSFMRRFIFLKPATFVVDDQVRSGSDRGTIRWLLQSQGMPRTAEDRIRIADGEGELVCENLLPKTATIRNTRQVGGREGRMSYRTEIVARDHEGEVRFLNVLHTRDRGAERSSARSELKERDGVLNLTVSTEERVFRLVLPPGRIGGGTLEVAKKEGGLLLGERLLPAGVLPYGREGARLLERWDSAYRNDGRPAWDKGKPATELRRAVEAGTIPPGRAVVLGCGTGTNAVYLARQGFDVTAIDIAPTALTRASGKAEKGGVRVRWLLASVLAVPELGPFDFIFDRGCYHAVRRQSAAAYVESLRRLSRPGTRFMLLAGNANEPPPHYGPPRVKETELRAELSPLFEFESLREIRFDSIDPEEKGALAWCALLVRKE